MPDARGPGSDLQAWLIRNEIDVTDPLFPAAVDLAVANAVRRAGRRRPSRPPLVDRLRHLLATTMG